MSSYYQYILCWRLSKDRSWTKHPGARTCGACTGTVGKGSILRLIAEILGRRKLGLYLRRMDSTRRFSWISKDADVTSEYTCYISAFSCYLWHVPMPPPHIGHSTNPTYPYDFYYWSLNASLFFLLPLSLIVEGFGKDEARIGLITGPVNYVA